MPGKLTLLLAATLFAVGCHLSAASKSGELAKNLARVTINQSTGNKTPIPVGRGFTIVNVFDDFSPGCPTGNRFDTVERFNSLRPAETAILLVFSDQSFSSQDVENFREMLPMKESLVQGNIETLRPYLIDKKLLVVLDSTGQLVWQEKANVSEQQLLDELVRLTKPASK